MKIEINNQQSLLKISKRKISKLITFFMGKASKLIPERQWQDISLVITDDDLISSVNSEFMGVQSTTDVLSFCLPPMPEAPALFAGEIFVNAQKAIDIARGGPKAVARELALYIAHACDHLMDEDDSDVPSRRRMRNRELRWLREADTMGLLSDIAIPARKAGSKK